MECVEVPIRGHGRMRVNQEKRTTRKTGGLERSMSDDLFFVCLGCFVVASVIWRSALVSPLATVGWPALGRIESRPAHSASTTRTRVVNAGSGDVRGFRPLVVVRWRIVTNSVSR